MNQTPRPDLLSLLYPNITLKGNTAVFYVYIVFTDLRPELDLVRWVCVYSCVYMYVSIYISEYECVMVYLSANKLTAVPEI
jgi:hypothetical protein